MTKEQRIAQALYHVANVSGFLGRPTKDLEQLYLSAKKSETMVTTKTEKDHFAELQIDLLTAIAVRKQYGLY